MRARLISIGWGALGVVIAVLLLHVYLDHLAFHEVLTALQQQAARAAQATPK